MGANNAESEHRFLTLVEDAWAYETNGELQLAPLDMSDEADCDLELAGLVIAMRQYARGYVDTVALAQWDRHGRELVSGQCVTDDDLASRIARCIAILSDGYNAATAWSEERQP